MTELAEQVSGDRLMADCAGFARYQKLSGTAPERASLGNVQAALDAAGFRTALLMHDAYISLPGAASVVVDGTAVTAITHSFSRPSPAGGLAAPVVDLGAGTDADFARPGVRGAIVLVDGIASPAVAARAARAGAAGQLHVSPHEHLHEMCISPVWGSPSAETVGDLPQTVTCTISLADGTALRGRLARGETPHVALHAEVDTGWRETPVLQADMDGPDPDGPFILFSGHHDTWYYGVMDNGSANATMLEAARLLATEAERVAARPAPVLLVRALARPLFRVELVRGLALGGTGAALRRARQRGQHRRHRRHPADGNGGAGGAEGAGGRDAIRAETNQELLGKRPNRNSDMSFWGVGIPSMFGSLSHQPPAPVAMRNALGWWWHTPHDLLDKVDEANLVRDTRVFVRTLWRLLTEGVLPLDIAAQAAALREELQAVEASLDGRLSLEPLLSAAAPLADAAKAPATDARLMRAARALVPADYTGGDRFAHDPALPMPAWPVLDPIRALARAPGGDAMRFARVGALRARNRLQHALVEAVRALSAET